MSGSKTQPWLVKQPVPPRTGAERRWALEALELIRRSPISILACVALMYALSGAVFLLAGHQNQVEVFHNILPAGGALIGPFIISTSVLIRIADLGKSKAQWNLAYRNALNLWIDLLFLPISLSIISLLPLAYITFRGENEVFRFTDYVRFLAFSTAIAPGLSGLFHFHCSIFESGNLMTLRLRARRAARLVKAPALFALIVAPSALAIVTPALGGGFLIVIGTVFCLVYQYCAWREVFDRNKENMPETTKGDPT